MYRLSEQQDEYVANMGRMIQNRWVCDFKWRRSLLEREIEEVNNMIALIQEGWQYARDEDHFLWQLEKSGKFSVKSFTSNFGGHSSGSNSD